MIGTWYIVGHKACIAVHTPRWIMTLTGSTLEASANLRDPLGFQACPKILIVDDHPLVREAVCCTVRAAFDQSMIREAGSVNEACQTARLHPQQDLILFDLMLPDVSGLDGLVAIRPDFPAAPVLVFTALDDAKIAAKAMALGAAGYVPKSAPKSVLLEAITEVLQGASYVPAQLASLIHAVQRESPASLNIAARVCSLTRCEIRVLQLVRQGLQQTNRL